MLMNVYKLNHALRSRSVLLISKKNSNTLRDSYRFLNSMSDVNETCEKMSFSESSRIKCTLDPCVVLMKEVIMKYHDLWKEDGGILSLAQGVVYWKPPPQAYDSLHKVQEDWHQYCPDEGISSLRSALKTKLEEENGLERGKTDVIITSGANQAFMNCVLTLLDEGDKSVIFKPYYFNHVMAIQMSRGDESLLVGPMKENGFPDISWLSSKLQKDNKIKMVTVVNPGNPTGVSLPRSTLNSIIELCGKYGVWVIVDNTYEHFDYIKANYDEKVAFKCSSETNVINIFSFSKGYSMAGFRVGYLALNTFSNKSIYQQMMKVQDTIPICASRISQSVALGALEAGRSWVLQKVNTLQIGKNAIIKALEPLQVIMGGSGAMYVMAQLPVGVDDLEAANFLVEKHGVAVIPGQFCGYPNWIRVCYSNLPPEKCMIAAERLSKGIIELCQGSENWLSYDATV